MRDFNLLSTPSGLELTFGTAGGDGDQADRSADSIMNNIVLSLSIRRGSWWFNRDFGLRSVERPKNTPQTVRLMEANIREALQWLIATGRAKSIDVSLQRETTGHTGRLLAMVEAVQADGQSVHYSRHFEVV